MIVDLTLENLVELGLDKQRATELLKHRNGHTFRGNEGNFYFFDNKVYTDIDFFKITCFKSGQILFPLDCPDLIPDFYSLALTDYLNKKKEILGLMHNEQHQTNEFIISEIQRSKQYIKSQLEYLEKHKHYAFDGKVTSIDVYKSYIHFLENQPQLIKKNTPEDFSKYILGETDFKEIAYLYNTGQNYQHKQDLIAVFWNCYIYYEQKFISYFEKNKIVPIDYFNNLIFKFRQNFTKDNSRVLGVNYFDDLIEQLMEKYVSSENQNTEKAEGKNDNVFINNFDNVNENKVYQYFKENLVDKKHLTEIELLNYLGLAFEKKTVPTNKLSFSDFRTKQTITKIFYTYYKKIAIGKQGNQSEYIKLLTNYFEGFEYKTIKSNFSK